MDWESQFSLNLQPNNDLELALGQNLFRFDFEPIFLSLCHLW